MIREATLDDEVELLYLAKRFFNEAPDTYDWDKAKVKELFYNLTNSDSGIVLVSETKEGIVGFLTGVVTEPLMSSKPLAVELGWFVDKNYRDGKTGLQLMSEFEKWAKSKGAAKVCMGDLVNLQNLGPLYERKGYKAIETTYMKEI